MGRRRDGGRPRGAAQAHPRLRQLSARGAGPGAPARAELRPVRLLLELSKPELGLAEQGVSSTIVVFGGTQIAEPAQAALHLAAAREAAARSPGDPQLARAAARAERIAENGRYYEAAREFAR